MEKKLVICALVFFAALSVVLALNQPNDTTLKEKASQYMAHGAFTRLSQDIKEKYPGNILRSTVVFHGPRHLERTILEIAFRKGFGTEGKSATGPSDKLVVYLKESERGIELELQYFISEGDKAPVSVLEKKSIRGLSSLVPPLTAIFLAFVLRRFLISLLTGIILGAMVIEETINPFAGLWYACKDYMLPAFLTEFSICIFLFIAFLIGMVQIMTRSGGIQGMIQAISHLVRGPRSSRFATFLMGLFIFFDDYTNTVIVGNAMRPLCDRWKVSREKLAYLVDSTAAPLAGLAVVSTWIGFEVGLLQALSDELGLGMGGYEIFFRLVPFRFYCIFTLMVVFLSILLNRDFGPMLKAEQLALASQGKYGEEKDPFVSASAEIGPKANIPHRWINGVVPIAVVILIIALSFFVMGTYEEIRQGYLPNPFSVAIWRSAFETASAYTLKILAFASFAGLLVALGMPVAQRLLTIRESVGAAFSGAKVMKYAIGILVLAWSMRDICNTIGTSLYLTSLISKNLDPLLIPLGTFVIASAIAFATGTSWGTMGILLPTIVPAAFQLGDMKITFLCLAAVLDGAIFGDHCSPISDTTILSSLTSGCSCMGHVTTQIPYGLLSAFLAVSAHLTAVYSSLPLGLIYFISAAGCVVFLLSIGRNPEKGRR
jgi:Na+/H+ antiporter NhaC